MSTPPIIPDPQAVAVEVATATKIAQERPGQFQGRTRPAGQSLADWLTNVSYWTLYGDTCPTKLPATGQDTCRAAWIRLRTAVDLALNQQAPKPAGPAWLWPLQAMPRRWTGGGSFSARRPWKPTKPQTRYHCGVDLGSIEGTAVLAPEGGVVISGDHGWESEKKNGSIVGVRAVVIRGDSGHTILLGGIQPGSGAPTGARVERGAVVGHVGRYPLGDQMLHVQVWDGALTLQQVINRQSWAVGTPKPAGLLDPAPFLKPALAAAPQALELGDQPDENGEVDEGTPAGAPATISIADLLGAVLGIPGGTA